MTPETLVLFDIDATLIRTQRAGIEAMGLAGRELYGQTFDEHCIEYAGRLDPLIIADLLRAHRVEVTPGEVERFRAGYARHLGACLAIPGRGGPCPGVPELLDALSQLSDVMLGLLTGNYPETGRTKLAACGIDADRFELHVWGCDSPHEPPERDHLPGVALERCAALGRGVTPERVVVVGDTPHDVRCALAHGCRALGVATGSFGVEELVTAGAHRAVADLSDTAEIVRWLTRTDAPTS